MIHAICIDNIFRLKGYSLKSHFEWSKLIRSYLGYWKGIGRQIVRRFLGHCDSLFHGETFFIEAILIINLNDPIKPTYIYNYLL